MVNTQQSITGGGLYFPALQSAYSDAFTVARRLQRTKHGFPAVSITDTSAQARRAA